MFVKTVSYQKVTDQESSTLLGQVCERTSRVEFFEGHARSGDIRATNYAGNELTWAPQQRDRWNAEASRARSRHEPDPGFAVPGRQPVSAPHRPHWNYHTQIDAA